MIFNIIKPTIIIMLLHNMCIIIDIDECSLDGITNCSREMKRVCMNTVVATGVCVRLATKRTYQAILVMVGVCQT